MTKATQEVSLTSIAIELAYQIAAFRRVESPWRNQFDHETVDLVDFVVSFYENTETNPARLRSSSFASVDHLSPRTGKRRAQKFLYPCDWVIDRSALNRAVKDFLRLTTELAESPVFLRWQRETPGETYNEPAQPLGRTQRVQTRIPRALSVVSSQELGRQLSLFDAPLQQQDSQDNVSGSTSPSVPSPQQSVSDPLVGTTSRLTLREPLTLGHKSSLFGHKPPTGGTRAPGSQHAMEASNSNNTADTATNDTTTNPTHHPSDPNSIMIQMIKEMMEQNKASMEQNRQLMSRLLDQDDQIRSRGGSQDQRQETPESGASLGDGTRGGWRQDDLGYFFPDLKDDDCVGDGPVVTLGSHTHYRDVLVFIDRIKDMATDKGELTVRTRVHASLRGAALQWFTAELTQFEKDSLRQLPIEQGWIPLLSKRFKKNAATAMQELSQLSYSMLDVREGRTPQGFVQSVIRLAQASGTGSTYSQILLAWNKLDPDLKQNVRIPTENTSLGDFILELEGAYTVWQEQAAKRQQMAESRRQQRASSGNYMFGNQRRFPSNPGMRYPVDPRQRADDNVQKSTDRYRYQQRQQTPQTQNYQYQQRLQTPQTQSYQYQQRQQTPQQTPQAQPRQTFPQRPYANPNRQQGYQQQGSHLGGNVFAGISAGRNTSQPARAYHGYYYDTGDIDYDGDPAHGQREDSNDFQEGFYQGAYYANQNDDGEDHQAHEDLLNQEEQDFRNWGFNEAANPGYAEDGFEHQSTDVNHVDSDVFARHECRLCHDSFTSGNRLHNHLREVDFHRATEQTQPQPTSDAATGTTSTYTHLVQCTTDTPELGDTRIIEVPRRTGETPGESFRKWRYATVTARFTGSTDSINPILDTGCSMTLVDRKFLREHLPHATIKRLDKPVRVRGIGTAVQESSEYTDVSMDFPATVGDEKVVLRVHMEMHIADELRTNMLIGSDIIVPSGMVLDFAKRQLRIDDAVAPIEVTPKQRLQPRPVYAAARFVIPPRSSARIPVRMAKDLPSDRDFLFEPGYKQTTVSLTAHVADANFSFVQIDNPTSREWTIPKKTRLGLLHDFDYTSAFLAEPNAGTLASTPPATEPQTPPAQTELSPHEQKLPNGVTVYGVKPSTRARFQKVIMQYDIWRDRGFVNVPENEWMTIKVTEDWEKEAVRHRKVYALGPKDREVVDKEFDELHAQNRMQWATNHTPTGHPVFVVWRDVVKNGKIIKKPRVVVDIRGLNKITEPDIYPIPLQDHILAFVAGKPYISTFDATRFFHQWRVKPSDRRFLAVVTHRGQEVFNVVVMGFKNAVAYVQRQMDMKLRDLQDFIRVYVDDLVAASDSEDEHVEHLHMLFGRLETLNIGINPDKSYVGYPSIHLLGQYVDGLGLSSAEEKLKAIAQLPFPATLKQLETYLGLTGWMRRYCPGYAAIAEPLESRKTLLLRSLPTDSTKTKRQRLTARTPLTMPTTAELNAYRQIQKHFANPSFLVHHAPRRQLYIDLDASAIGFSAVLYHVRDEDLEDGKHLSKIAPPVKAAPEHRRIQPVLFMSRRTNQAEKNYWPTEMEVACLVWVLRKVRHIIETAQDPVIVFTDHSATLAIATQTTLTTSSTDKLNLRLVRASQYIQQFRIKLRHKAGKRNVVADALSRLPSPNSAPDEAELDREVFFGSAYAGDATEQPLYSTTLLELSEDFKQQLLQGYQADPHWSRVIAMLRTYDDQQDENAPALPFILREGLLYTIDMDGTERLCLPTAVLKDIFRMVHDDIGHLGRHRMTAALRHFAIHRLMRQVKAYITHCHGCQLNRTRRHAPYGNYQPILTPDIPFHTIAIDFIMGLPDTGQFNQVLTVTYKFTKQITFIAGRDSWTAKEWAAALLERLTLGD
ncbi:hypothetical protein DTO045G8_6601 [Paecilomyces variotii]|nr:hypothetical protein DTO045G8_6601 [Paecilomyces variotii]